MNSQIILWNLLEWGLIGLLVVFGIVLVFATWSLLRIIFEVLRDGWRAGRRWLLLRRAAAWWRS